ncbi:prolipoprotein diacylglyceryl transferase [Myxococcota bacterium]|nr:prolipoprotein diacylglyceryl transferase [Myxococcota bacterium]MBU1413137.1 prolipoprotein diacylglyceryl transferase [Myxococcota bacterium]MBU1511103.1 prolipoprotein diacylglyceryl transferase [Myxococcota bacterium]
MFLPIPALAPIFPYINIGPLQWGGFTVHPFGILVAAAIFTAMYFVQQRGERLGLNPVTVSELVTVTVIMIFVGSHLFEILAYQPERIREDPWVLLRVWDGIASFGGLLGLLATAVYFSVRGKLSFLTSTDVLLWGGVHAWIFGRLGCSVAHDHPGLFTDSWFSVRWPINHPDQVLNVHGLAGRYDLGLFEFLYTFIMLGILYFTHRRWRWKPGFTTAIVFVSYAPVRFYMDFLRAVDRRYLYLTPAQYGSLAMFSAGLFLLWRYRRSEATTDSSSDAAT